MSHTRVFRSWEDDVGRAVSPEAQSVHFDSNTLDLVVGVGVAQDFHTVGIGLDLPQGFVEVDS